MTLVSYCDTVTQYLLCTTLYEQLN